MNRLRLAFWREDGTRSTVAHWRQYEGSNYLHTLVCNCGVHVCPTDGSEPSCCTSTRTGSRRISAVAGAKATPYMYWVRLGISGNKPSVYIDEKEILRMRSGHFLGVNLDPGQHVVRSTEKAAAVTLDAKPGETYYIRLGFAGTQFKVRVETTLVPPELGWSELAKTKPSDPEDIKNHDFPIVDSMPQKPAASPAHEAECRSVAVTPSRSFTAESEYKVVDVANYPGGLVPGTAGSAATERVCSSRREG